MVLEIMIVIIIVFINSLLLSSLLYETTETMEQNVIKSALSKSLCIYQQMLLCEVSNNVKESLQSTVGCVSVASFHALVCCQSDPTGHVTQQVPAVLQQTTGDLVGSEMSTFKAGTSSAIAIQRMSLPNKYFFTFNTTLKS